MQQGFSGLNMGALGALQENLNNRGNGNYIRPKDITPQFDFRLAGPLPHHNGLYLIERKVWWIAGKPYTDPSTLGLHSVMEDELKIAREQAKTDVGLATRLADNKQFKPNTAAFYMAGFQLKAVFSGPNLISCDIVDGKCKVLDCGTSLAKAINREVTGRNGDTGSPLGIMDRQVGVNLILSKTGTGLATEYGAALWRNPMAMDPALYADIPDIFDIVKKEIKSDEYLRSVIRNFFYGTPIIAEAPHAGVDAVSIGAPSAAQGNVQAYVQTAPVTQQAAPAYQQAAPAYQPQQQMAQPQYQQPQAQPQPQYQQPIQEAQPQAQYQQPQMQAQPQYQQAAPAQQPEQQYQQQAAPVQAAAQEQPQYQPEQLNSRTRQEGTPAVQEQAQAQPVLVQQPVQTQQPIETPPAAGGRSLLNDLQDLNQNK